MHHSNFYWVAKTQSESALYFSVFLFILILFFIFSVSVKVLSVNPMLSGVFVHRVLFAYFVRFEEAGEMHRFLWCTQENI